MCNGDCAWNCADIRTAPEPVCQTAEAEEQIRSGAGKLEGTCGFKPAHNGVVSDAKRNAGNDPCQRTGTADAG